MTIQVDDVEFGRWRVALSPSLIISLHREVERDVFAVAHGQDAAWPATKQSVRSG